MPPRYRRAIGPGRGVAKRRSSAWITYDPGILTVTNSVTGFDVTNDWEVAGGNLLGNTVVRTHLALGVSFAAATDLLYVGLIVGRISDIGATAPDPGSVNARDLKWMLNTRIFPSSSGATFNAMEMHSFDLKAKRRMTQLDERLILCLKRVSATGNCNAFARVLVQLP